MNLYAVYHTDYISAGDADDPVMPDVVEAETACSALQEIAEHENNNPWDIEDECAVINLTLLFGYLRNHGYKIEVPAMPRVWES